jgi:dihydropyrimidinase
MSDLVTVLRGADAVLPHGRARVDLGFGPDGRIEALGAAGMLAAPDIVDATGLVALPGAIDLHVHLNTFFGGTTTRDDFFQGTAAALFGGTTTIAQFAIPRAGETTTQALARTHAEARPAVASDYTLHGCVVRETYEPSIGQLASLPGEGVRSVKIFSAYADAIGLSLGQIHRLLGEASASGITVFVHAETDSLIREGIENVVRAGELGPHGHPLSRSPLAESDAIRSISDLALDTGATVYFVHVSSAPSVATLADRRGRGERILAETCPHYLFLDAAVYDGPHGENWICSPPIRGVEHREALWDGLIAGVLDTVSSDHNCFDTAQKAASRADFRRVPNGLPGIEHRLPLLLGATLEGRLQWSRLAAISAENPARILGLWPRKGAIVVGSDADIVLVDPAGTTDLGPAHMATDYSPYEGMRSAGRIVRVYRRGSLVVADGELRAERGSGRWIPPLGSPPPPGAAPALPRATEVGA